MFARLTFRHRIGLLVLLTAMGLIAVTVVTLVLLRHSEQQLSGIETRYVPLIELDRDLDAMFSELNRAFENAAAAADEARLADAEDLHGTMSRRIVAGARIIAENGGDPHALRAGLRRYYESARHVSEQLMNGTAVDELGPQIDAMRHSRELLSSELGRATTPDRRRLAAAFATARESQRRAVRIDVVVAASVLALMGLLSWRLIRRTVQRLRAVATGVERLAGGELGEEIEVGTPDEIGELAREANRTAARLRDYRDHSAQLLRETQRQADQLRAAYEQLERASNYKTAFLANMAHELRTPLNSIMIMSKVLAENADRTLSKKHTEFATLINKCGMELLAMINEVLDVAKIEAGKQTLTCARLRLDALEGYMRMMFEPVAAERKLAFDVEVAPDRPDVIVTDEARVAQIVKNLLSNAFKFTERGSVTVRVTSADPGVAISVTDTGIGIAADKLSWVFDAFTQADTRSNRKHRGTGLGLTISKQLAARLGGELVVESELGRGSTFTLRLPLAAPTADTVVVPPPSPPPPRVSPPAVSPAPAIDPSLAGKTVLLVDDDMRNLYSLASALRAGSIRVVAAPDAGEALAALDREPNIDAVLMDVVMPVIGGHEAMLRIRGQARFKTLPIVAFTKPVDMTQLLETLRRSVTPSE